MASVAGCCSALRAWRERGGLRTMCGLSTLAIFRSGAGLARTLGCAACMRNARFVIAAAGHNCGMKGIEHLLPALRLRNVW